MKTCCILGGNGFIGHHMARRLKKEGYWVRVVDIKEYEYGANDYADDVMIGDLRDKMFCSLALHAPNQIGKGERGFDEVYCFACLMGGAQFIFTRENDSDIMSDSALININILKVLSLDEFKGKIFYSSSACIYPQGLQEETQNSGLKETSAYPAYPDSCYGWEKLFSENLFTAFARNKGLNIRIARFHNIYGPEGTYKGGKEKAPAAICRKVAENSGLINIYEVSGNTSMVTSSEPYIEVFGDGQQTRSFLYIDECIEGVRRLMNSDCTEPVNIGSDEMVSINDLAKMAIDISGKNIQIKNIESNALGVRGRNSDNDFIFEQLGWKPNYPLRKGMEKTYKWINEQVNYRFDLTEPNKKVLYEQPDGTKSEFPPFRI